MVSHGMTRHRIIIGDSRQLDLPDESADLVVTSPPYWSIKDYGVVGQIGQGQEYKEYLDDLTHVLYHSHRVLRPGCRMVLNVGDQFLRASKHGRYRIQPIPADLIIRAREINFDFMGQIIWRKISTTTTSGGGKWMGSIYYPKDGHITYEHEYLLVFRKQGTWKKPDDPELVEASRLTYEERQSWFRGIWGDLPPARQVDHPAQFPIELPRRIIKMWSFAGELVFDPFAGVGTVAMAAHELGRRSIGYEIRAEYAETARKRAQAQGFDLELIRDEQMAPTTTS